MSSGVTEGNYGRDSRGDDNDNDDDGDDDDNDDNDGARVGRSHE